MSELDVRICRRYTKRARVCHVLLAGLAVGQVRVRLSVCLVCFPLSLSLSRFPSGSRMRTATATAIQRCG